MCSMIHGSGRASPKTQLYCVLTKNKRGRAFPGGPVVKNPLSNAGMWVPSLAGELDPTCHS